MAINFPTSLDTTAQPSAGQVVDSARIAKLIQMVEALEAKAGVNNSAVTTSLDYKVNHISAGGGYYQPTGEAVIAWTADPLTCDTSVNPGGSGVLQVARVSIPSATTVSKVNLFVVSAGTVSASYGGLYTSAGALLSQSASGGALTGDSVKAFTLSAAQSVAAGTYYAAFFIVYSGAPSLLCISTVGTANQNNPLLAAPNLRVASADTGLTTTMPATMGTQTASIRPFWVALT